MIFIPDGCAGLRAYGEKPYFKTYVIYSFANPAIHAIINSYLIIMKEGDCHTI